MRRSNDPTNASAIVDAVFETIGSPVKSSSLFYALYYLVEVEGVSEAALDFKRLREQQDTAFFWYGLVTAANELAHLEDNFYIEGVNLVQFEHMRPDKNAAEWFVDELEIEGDDRQTVVLDYIGHLDEFTPFDQDARMTRTLRNVDDLFGVIEDPQGFIRNVRWFFETLPHTESGRSYVSKNRETGWVHGFDGPAWVGICDHLLRRGELSATAFVDTSWSIEHNNGNWFNKLVFNRTPAELDAIIDVLGLDVEVGKPEESWRYITNGDVLRGTAAVLDLARDGPTSRLFDVAEYFTRDLDVNLRHLRRQLGL